MPRYYKFKPADILVEGGTYTNAHLGEIVAGETYEVPDNLVPAFEGNIDWQRVKNGGDATKGA